MEIAFVYVTASDSDEASTIGCTVVQERLAACANVLPAMMSIYWWQGEVQSASEAVLILKTRSELVDRLTERVKALHSYDVPCIVALPVVGGNEAFLEWVGSATHDPEAI